MKVKAIRAGYYDHVRRREGEVFFMEEDAYYVLDPAGKKVLGKDKKPRVCSWVKPFDKKEEVVADDQEVDDDLEDDDDAI